MISDTIFAVASGPGKAAIRVLRLSGPGTAAALERLAGPLPPPRRLSLRTLSDPETGEPLDQALVAWMPGPASFTGEDQAELHVHGGLAVRAGVVRALSRLPGCRPAEPGEFSRRAFLNGRLDLAGVEALADLIDAETEAQARQALRQLDGHLSRRAEDWRARLIEALALAEAALDFSDEGDVPDHAGEEARRIAAELEAELARALDDGGRGERLREGFTVVLAGPPNAGKSTLLNALARRDVAIVSEVPGTTRDAIEVRCDLQGLPVTFVDTAGLRDSADPVERAGMDRTRRHLAGADLVLWLEPGGEGLADAPLGAWRVRTKVDLLQDGVEESWGGAGAHPSRSAREGSEGNDGSPTQVPHPERLARNDGSPTHPLILRRAERPVSKEGSRTSVKSGGLLRDAADAAPQDEGLGWEVLSYSGPASEEAVRPSRRRLPEAAGVLEPSFETQASPAPQDEESGWKDVRPSSRPTAQHQGSSWDTQLSVSALTGEGLEALVESVRAQAEAAMGTEDVLITRARHRHGLEAARGHLARLLAAGPDHPAELLAEDVRLAARALAAITGRVDVEQVLDRLFSSFCIGK